MKKLCLALGGVLLAFVTIAHADEIPRARFGNWTVLCDQNKDTRTQCGAGIDVYVAEPTFAVGVYLARLSDQRWRIFNSK